MILTIIGIKTQKFFQLRAKFEKAEDNFQPRVTNLIVRDFKASILRGCERGVLGSSPQQILF